MAAFDSHLTQLRANLGIGRATTFVLPRQDWGDVSSAVAREVIGEVARISTGKSETRDPAVARLLYQAVAQGQTAELILEGINRPFLDLLFQLTKSTPESRRGLIRWSERVHVTGMPPLVINPAFNFVALAQPEQFNGPLARELTRHTDVIHIAGGSGHDWSLASDEDLKRLTGKTTASDAQAGDLFDELLRRNHYMLINTLLRLLGKPEPLLERYGLELSKHPWRPAEAPISGSDEVLTFAADTGFWVGCKLTASVSRPIRRHLLSLLNSPKMLHSAYAHLREKCVLTFNNLTLAKDEYQLLKKYEATEPIADIRCLCLDVEPTEPAALEDRDAAIKAELGKIWDTIARRIQHQNQESVSGDLLDARILTRIYPRMMPRFLAWSPRGDLLTYIGREGVTAWDLNQQKVNLLVPKVWYSSFSFSRSGDRVVGCWSSGGGEVRSMQPGSAPLLAFGAASADVCYFDSAENIWVGSFNNLFVFARDGRQILCQHTGFGQRMPLGVNDIVFYTDRRDGEVAVLGMNKSGSVSACQLRGDAIEFLWEMPLGSQITSLSWDPGQTRLAASTCAGALALLLPGGRELARFTTQASSRLLLQGQKRVAWDHTGKYIATTFGREDQLYVFDEQGRECPVPELQAFLVAWHPHRPILAVACMGEKDARDDTSEIVLLDMSK